MTSLVVLGAGGLARILVDALRARGLSVVGFVTNISETAIGVMAGIPRLGTDDEVLARGPAGVSLVNGIGSIRVDDRRRAVFERFRARGFAFAQVIHPAAVVAADTAIGEGAQIMAGAILQPGVRVGVNALVNMGALIDHDCRIGDHVHVAPGAGLAGDVQVGDAAFVGMGARVLSQIHVGERATIAAGAIVTADVADGATVMGIPARAKLSG